ncbi:MAG: phosphate ABC transporter permease subunit PstC [Caulobacterales bacterium]|nr:phosphate ABC transporter permease subunit PstC [Caulobacterales bacterium]
MQMSLMLGLALIVCAVASFQAGRGRAVAAAADSGARAHSLPNYHGWFVAMWSVGPALLLLALYGIFGGPIVDGVLRSSLPEEVLALPPERLELFVRDARAIAFGGTPSQDSAALAAAAASLRDIDGIGRWGMAAATLATAALGFVLAHRRVGGAFRARAHVENVIKGGLIICSVIAILTTLGIVASLFLESLRFFARVPPHEFLFGLQWSPQTALRADQVAGSGAFGAAPLFYGTMMITGIAMLVAAPIGLYAAIFLSEYASSQARAWIKPVLEILAGIPTVVYGFFALLTVGPLIRGAAASLGVDAPTQSALAAGLVMGIMIIPFVSSLSDDVINAVPQSLRDGSFAMGATRSETVRNVVIPAALPGIMGALLLAISRAVGETMIVVMAAGRAANMPINPLESVTTITVQIVALLTGDQEFDSAKTLSAFALGLVLFFVTLAMNIVALQIVQRYREKYD